MTAALSDVEVPARVTVRPALRREPPFDDEVEALGAGRLDRPLPLEWSQSADPEVVGSEPSALRAALPEPATWARRLLIGITETAAGKRPLHQVAALLTPAIASGLGADLERAARNGSSHWTSTATVRSVRSSEPAEGVAELSATVATGWRVRAVAMRLEVRHGRWCCTRLQLG